MPARRSGWRPAQRGAFKNVEKVLIRSDAVPLPVPLLLVGGLLLGFGRPGPRPAVVVSGGPAAGGSMS
jgi:hypothetical protein